MAQSSGKNDSDEFIKLKEDLEAALIKLTFKEKQWLAYETRHGELYSNLEKEVIQLNLLYETCQGDKVKCIEEIDKRDRSIRQLETEKEKLNDIVRKKNNEVINLDKGWAEKVKKLENNNKDHQYKLDEYKDQLRKKKVESDGYILALHLSRKECERLEKQCSEFEKERKKYFNKYEECEAEFKEFRRKHDVSSKQKENVAGLEKKVKEYEEKIKEFKCADNVKVPNNDGEFKACQDELEALKKHISEIPSECEALTMKIKQGEEEFKRFRNDVKRKQEESQRKCDQDTISKRKEIDALLEARDDYEKQMKDLKRKYDELEVNWLEKYNSEKERTKKADSDLKNVKMDLETCQEDLDEVTSDRDRLKEVHGNLKDVAEKYEECLREKGTVDDKYKELEEKYKQCESDVEKCREDLENIKREKEDLEKELENCKGELTSCKSEEEKLRNKYQQCKDILKEVRRNKQT